MANLLYSGRVVESQFDHVTISTPGGNITLAPGQIVTNGATIVLDQLINFFDDGTFVVAGNQDES